MISARVEIFRHQAKQQVLKRILLTRWYRFSEKLVAYWKNVTSFSGAFLNEPHCFGRLGRRQAYPGVFNFLYFIGVFTCAYTPTMDHQ